MKATKDHMISVHVWGIPRKRIGVNRLNERPKEAKGVYSKDDCSIPAGIGKYPVGVYAKDDCSIPAGMGKYILVQTNREITGEVLIEIRAS